MRHTYETPVRFDDVDMYGHVNNVAFAGYLQEARVDFAYRNLRGRASDLGTVVVYQTVNYLQPVPFRTEPLQVHVWVTRIGESSFDLAYEIGDTSTPVVRAASTMVAYDIEAGRSRPISPGERAVFETFVEEHE